MTTSLEEDEKKTGLGVECIGKAWHWRKAMISFITKTGNCGLRGQKPMWRKALCFAWSQVCERLPSEDGGVLLGLKWEGNAAVWRLSGCRAAQDASSVCIGNGLG